MNKVMLSEYVERFGVKTTAFKTLSRVLKEHGDMAVLITSPVAGEIFPPDKDDIFFNDAYFDEPEALPNPTEYGEYRCKYDKNSPQTFTDIRPTADNHRQQDELLEKFMAVLVGDVD